MHTSFDAVSDTKIEAFDQYFHHGEVQLPQSIQKAKGTGYSIDSNFSKRPVSGFNFRNVDEQVEQPYADLESLRAMLMEP